MLELSQRVRESLPPPLPKRPQNHENSGKTLVVLEESAEISSSLGSGLDGSPQSHGPGFIFHSGYVNSKRTLNIWGQCHAAGMEQDCGICFRDYLLLIMPLFFAF